MIKETTLVTSSTMSSNIFYIHRPDGSEIKVMISDTNENFKQYYPLGNHFLISPVALSPAEVDYFQKNMLLID